MNGLAEFIVARLGEDQAIADGILASKPDPHAPSSQGAHRLLREVAAKRALLKAADRAYYAADHYVHDDILAALASVYSGHPDYQQEWKP